MHQLKYVINAFLGIGVARASSLVSQNGQWVAVPSWDIQSSAVAPSDIASLSLPGEDTSTWHHIGVSRCTVMGCLMTDGTYSDAAIWFSDTMKSIDPALYQVPWLYRNQFSLQASPGRHFFLQTSGVTPRGDVYFNGQQLADFTVQSGTYTGHVFDITSLVNQTNAVLISAYPTNYQHDFAQGFVDWNPYPADNGTGVWRNVTVKQTGPVLLGPLLVATDFDVGGSRPATVTLKVTARNLENTAATITVNGHVSRDTGDQAVDGTQTVTLGPGQTQELSLPLTVDDPAIWWPKQWGDQPLYSAQLTVLDAKSKAISDTASKGFGFRQVTSEVNSYNDTIFTVNGKEFQVLGGGYAPDMFLRWDSDRFTTLARYALDMGLNTIRLEGKLEQPELYDIADRLGLMLLPGFECCDKWEAWPYNSDTDDLGLPVPFWDDADYQTANMTMITEASMLQAHPSVLAFLVGSDDYPDDRATDIYVSALKAAEWSVPIICSAAKQGFPEELGPSGLKMDGPYEWVPPNYWMDTEPSESRLGAAFGFGSEQSAGCGTPELSSLKKFLSQSDLDDLWKSPNKTIYHMSRSSGQFGNRKIYNTALWSRWGAPSSLDDYLMKAHISDYEATRSMFEGFSAMWNAERPATGVIYWMLNTAWPGLHWQLFDHYFHPTATYFAAKAGSRTEHVMYDPVHKSVWLINHSLDRQGDRKIVVEAVGLDGKSLVNNTVSVNTAPNTSKNIPSVSGLSSIKEVAFLKLTLLDENSQPLSRNVYWLATTLDKLDWDDSQWFITPVTKYADFKAFNTLEQAQVKVSTATSKTLSCATSTTTVTIENLSSVPAFFIVLDLVDHSGQDVNPVTWSDNYLTLFPHETVQVTVTQNGGIKGDAIQFAGKNVAASSVAL